MNVIWKRKFDTIVHNILYKDQNGRNILLLPSASENGNYNNLISDYSKQVAIYTKPNDIFIKQMPNGQLYAYMNNNNNKEEINFQIMKANSFEDKMCSPDSPLFPSCLKGHYISQNDMYNMNRILMIVIINIIIIVITIVIYNNIKSKSNTTNTTNTTNTV